jgi:hypothetical protein
MADLESIAKGDEVMKHLVPLVLLILQLCVANFAFQEEYNYPTPEPTPWIAPTPEPTPEPTIECDHVSDRATRFEQVRLLPPAKIKSFDPRSIEYLHEDKFGIYVGRLNMDEETVMPKDLWKEYKQKHYWILYCLRCSHVYTIVSVSGEQIRAAHEPKKNRISTDHTFPR